MRNLDDDPPVITLSAGPVDAYPAVLRALSRPVTYDFDPSFQRFYEAAVLKTAEALRTALPPVILQGEPVLGLEAAAAALIRSDDAVLNLASGEYGKGFGVWAARHCRELVEIEVPYDDAVDPDTVREMLRARPDIRILSVCHHDTPSGTINPVREIGAICRAHDVLTIVDAVSSFGGMDVHPEAVHADIFVTGPNKCLGGSTGLCIVHVSERAWARIDANPAAPTGSVLSLRDWRDAWRADVLFPYTPSVSEVHALDAAVRNYLDEGPEAVWARHALTARACRAGVRAIGPRPLARARGDLRRYRDDGAGARRPGRCGDPAGGAPALRRGLLRRPRLAARQAGANRPYGAGRPADLCHRGGHRAGRRRQCAGRAGRCRRRRRGGPRRHRRHRRLEPRQHRATENLQLCRQRL